MITERYGDLLDDPAEAHVNPVNTVGVMGAGLAKQFKDRWPDMFDEYRQLCSGGRIYPGRLHVWRVPARLRAGILPLWIINFPTKRHWSQPSQIDDIVDGLHDLQFQIRCHDIASIAIPMLGCGHGRLSPEIVRPLIRLALGNIDNLHTTLYLGPWEGR